MGVFIGTVIYSMWKLGQERWKKGLYLVMTQGAVLEKISLGCIRNDLKLKDLYALLPLFVTVAMSKNFPMFL